MLTDHVRYLLENPEELHTGKYASPQTRGKFFADRRKDIEMALAYVAFVAPRLPEKQRQRTLSWEKLNPLIHAILSYEPEKPDRGAWLANERAFQVALMIMDEAKKAALEIIPSEELGRIISADQSRDLYARAIDAFAESLKLKHLAAHVKTQRKTTD